MLDARSNVIILSPGLAGSSVLTNMISRAGYWTGDTTVKKPDYDTHENVELVDLNIKLIAAAGFTGDYTMEFRPAVVEQIAALWGTLDAGPYETFLKKCNSHRPWIWKDPRLSLTIGFWQRLLPLVDCRFLVLTRDHLQAWISTTLRRQIQTYRYSKAYNLAVEDSIVRSLGQAGLSYLRLRYEDLIVHPQEALARLNAYLDTRLSEADLRRVYNKPLGVRPRSTWDLATAVLVYAKNYRHRYR